jgi:hypothetical protein
VGESICKAISSSFVKLSLLYLYIYTISNSLFIFTPVILSISLSTLFKYTFLFFLSHLTIIFFILFFLFTANNTCISNSSFPPTAATTTTTVVSLGKDPNPAQTHHPRPISAAQTQQPPQATDSTTPGLGKDPNPPNQQTQRKPTTLGRSRQCKPNNHPKPPIQPPQASTKTQTH